ncbi:MAG TPA: CRISPR system precrRNA processing endoribonuclease RAMP protein Cas6 [Bryobacteraceae bacterium]|nr:CRISPR system precrRNA processing endoribonuclease RAMP protein Cas6 [Bryobacteraceae bacterium]
MRNSCPYARTFEPTAMGAGPSGLADLPRPFVFRAKHLDGRTAQAGTRFHFDVNLFQVRDPPIPYFVLAFAQLAREGLGPGRGRAVLERVEQLHVDGGPPTEIFDGRRLQDAVRPSVLSLAPADEPISGVRVRFLTPTELKSEQELARQPEFGALMARIRDRLSTLSALYGAGALKMDFASFGRRAAAVRLVHCDLELVEAQRLSRRTGRRHPLGGFVGVAAYEGELREFVPFLQAARFSGVGRQTTWGKGELDIQVRKGGLTENPAKAQAYG